MLTIAGTTLDNNPIQIGAIIPVILILAWIHMRNLRARARGMHKPKRETRRTVWNSCSKR